ncbi:MAG TPA: hypothetical protein VIT91_14125 [Chthoniobacterales bacterium]
MRYEFHPEALDEYEAAASFYVSTPVVSRVLSFGLWLFFDHEEDSRPERVIG